METALKEKWVEALRSGNYKQGKGVLKTPYGSYCCLGVLCDISKTGTWKPGGDGDVYTVVTDEDTYRNEYVIHSQLLEEYFGLTTDQQAELTKKNDGTFSINGNKPAEDFNKIADFIEKEL